MIIPLQNYKNLLNNIISNFDFNLIVLKFGVKYLNDNQIEFGIQRIYHRYTPCIPKVYRQYAKFDDYDSRQPKVYSVLY